MALSSNKIVGIKSVLGKTLLVLTLTGAALFSVPSKDANACGFCDITVSLFEDSIWQDAIDDFNHKLDEEFVELEDDIIHEIWEQSVLPVMMKAAEQYTAVAIQQAMAIGMFIDAENQLNSQRLLQELKAQVHKDYHPSIEMCEFGSLMKSVAATERLGEVTPIVMSQRSQDRQMGLVDTAGVYGTGLSKGLRVMHYRGKFCRGVDRGNALASFCQTLLSDADSDDNGVISAAELSDVMDADGDSTVSTAESLQFYNDLKQENFNANADVDYVRFFDANGTLDVNFTNNKLEIVSDPVEDGDYVDSDEETLFSMAANLYGHDNFARIPAKLLENRPKFEATTAQETFLEMRSLIAKRSVAENSFYAIAGMKTQGIRVDRLDSSGNVETDGNGNDITDEMHARVFMEGILTELGVPDSEVVQLLGENPSYYAQMEILTKKIYQNPDFYTNLYDKPANVGRKEAAMQAIKLMQKFDMLKSFLRGEASVSILLELAVVDLQQEVEDQILAMEISN